MTDAKTSLQNFLDSEEKVDSDFFAIKDDAAANWALRKIAEYQNKITENNALAIAEIEKIETWNQSENNKAMQSIDYFQGLLGRYALERRNADSKFKTLKLPNGRIKFVKQQPKYNYDNKAVVEFLNKSDRKNLVKVKTTEEPDKTAIKKLFVIQDSRLIDPETGEFIEGVTIEHLDDAFKVEVDNNENE